MKNKSIIISFFWMVSLSGIAQTSVQIPTETLQDYLKIAADNNPQLKATFNNYMAAMEKVPQVGTLPDPQFAFAYFVQPVETRVGAQRLKLGLQQMFPWFGSLQAKENVAMEKAQVKYELFENSKSNLFFEVKTTYYNYYFVIKAIQITKDNMEILQIFKNLSLVKIESGNASIVDELRVELELNDLENQLALFVDTKNTLRVSFNNLLNRNKNTMIAVSDTLQIDKLPYDKVSMLDSIYASNHTIKSIDHKLNAFLNQEIVAKKQGSPSFNIGVNYIVVDEIPGSTIKNNGKDAFLFPSVGLTIPIYRKKYKASIKEAQYLQEAAKENKISTKNKLSSIFEKTYKDYKDGERRIALNKKQSEIAKKVLDVLIVSYSTNSNDFEEVLRIERQLLGYKLAHQKALIDNNAAVAFMHYLLGN